MPDVTPALAVLGGAGWDIQKPTPYVGGNQLPNYTWLAKPAANLVPVGAVIRITDVGPAPGIRVVSDGSSWYMDGPQMLARSAVLVAVTGTTAETVLATATIPGGLLGPNGGLLIYSAWSITNSANNKTPRIRFGGAAGTPYLSASFTANASYSDIRRIRNRNSAASQVGGANVSTTLGTGNALATSTVDTTSAVDIVFTGALALGTESMGLENYEIWGTP